LYYKKIVITEAKGTGTLNQLLNTAPQKSIVLLEDIDRAFSNDSRVTVSGLLNALDGVAAQEGRLIFMTTNHVESLHPALIRPGRADVRIKLSNASRAQIAALFIKFFPGEDELAKRFAAALPEDELSMAQLQAHLFLHRKSAESAVEYASEFYQSVVEEKQHIQSQRRAGA
jgi:chaperone BCS1